MPRGGKRDGAGRKFGSKTKRVSATLSAAAARGMDPADVLQEAMQRYHAAGEWDKAVEVANYLMPYRHPRKGSLVVRTEAPPPVLVTEILVVVHATLDQPTPAPAVVLPAPAAGEPPPAGLLPLDGAV